MSHPNKLRLIAERSHPLMPDVCDAGLTIDSCMILSLSPIVFECNEAWKPLLDCLSKKFGYVWEWTQTEAWPEDCPKPDYYSFQGEVVITKVEE